VPKWETWLVRFGLKEWRRGEIAILKPPEGTPYGTARFPVLGFSFRAFFIKRIVAVPGDEVYVERGVVHVNGVPLLETHITDHLSPWPDSFPGVCYKDGRMTRIITQQGDFPVDLLPAYLKPLKEMLLPPSEGVLKRSRLEESCEVGRIRLKKGYYFVMGDNRTLGRLRGLPHLRARARGGHRRAGQLRLVARLRAGRKGPPPEPEAA
jgi:signal peptidase I